MTDQERKFKPGDLVRYIGADIFGCFTTVGVISNDRNRELYWAHRR